MRTSTKDDIVKNMQACKDFGRGLLDRNETEDDWWDTLVIGDMAFDFNVWAWGEEDGRQVTNVSVYPVNVEGEGYLWADMSTFVRLWQKDIETGSIKERGN